MAKQFKVPNYQDFEIYDGDKKIGDVRVKPSGILWSPAGKHSWYRVSIDDFAAFAVKNGTEQAH